MGSLSLESLGEEYVMEGRMEGKRTIGRLRKGMLDEILANDYRMRR
jgi:hypothetical protein